MNHSAAADDISGRADLDVVLRRFYTAAFADPRIGPFFTEIAGTDLDVHLPRITDFWERSLFRTAAYRRNAYAPHAALHSVRELTAADFGRWVQLWNATIDGLHRGPNAERAKAQGERIALTLLKRLVEPGRPAAERGRARLHPAGRAGTALSGLMPWFSEAALLAG